MDWNQFLNNAATSPMVNMGLGMMQAAGPSMQPVGFGQALSSGMQTMGQMKRQQMLAQMYQAEMDRMKAKTQQEQEKGAREKSQRASLFGNPAPGPQQGGQALPDPMQSTGLQQLPVARGEVTAPIDGG